MGEKLINGRLTEAWVTKNGEALRDLQHQEAISTSCYEKAKEGMESPEPGEGCSQGGEDTWQGLYSGDKPDCSAKAETVRGGSRTHTLTSLSSYPTGSLHSPIPTGSRRATESECCIHRGQSPEVQRKTIREREYWERASRKHSIWTLVKSNVEWWLDYLMSQDLSTTRSWMVIFWSTKLLFCALSRLWMFYN